MGEIMNAERITKALISIERAADELVEAMRVLDSAGKRRSVQFVALDRLYGEVLDAGMAIGAMK